MILALSLCLTTCQASTYFGNGSVSLLRSGHKVYSCRSHQLVMALSYWIQTDLFRAEFLKSTLRVFGHRVNSIVEATDRIVPGTDLEFDALVSLIAVVLSGAESALCHQVQLGAVSFLLGVLLVVSRSLESFWTLDSKPYLIFFPMLHISSLNFLTSLRNLL